MSGEGPESIPTSADPRSKRPTKKRALTPVSEQAATVDALFAKPDVEIRIPPSSTSTSSTSNPRSRLAPPPEIVTNVQGSSAGAGSGEFHVYKASRRREYERLRAMDEEVAAEREAEDFERQREERERRDDEKTRRNREKRDKMKARKAKAKSGGKKDGAGGGGPAANGSGTAKHGVKPRMVARKDGEKDTGEDDEPAQDAPAGTAGEMQGIVIEDD